ncbi:choloylglycine hydrolase [Pseudoflavonifractor phocaeensis]|uniref:choloylglycine hydrolase n=1 Tax=Pseudoflavonifractor phocaeensis TaxID=1870988 RepID=UPI00195AF055|nr:choloylglycine hydrolase [Pseudoflavonifractor phocaeensis]MBM6721707.1 choloylglycine hydrolase family protein [Pseudoflavonifractor phocaeensis]
MCTSIALTTKDTYTGRNLDLEYAFGEKVVITPRQFPLQFHKMPALETHQAIIGMASVAEGYPLYAEGVNESGVYMAGLNFPDNTHYPPEGGAGEALAPYELIPWLLGTCKTAAEAAEHMKRIPLLGVPFRPDMPLAPLHWHIADRHGAFVAEPMEDGVKVYPDPVGVLTNNPPFPFHRTNLTQYRGLSAAQPDNTLDPALELPTFGQGMGAIGLPGDWSPASRYLRAAFCKRNSVCENSEESSVSQFFHLLDTVAMPRGAVRTPEGNCDITRYSCCINTATGTYYYKTYDNCAITAVALTEERRAGDRLLEFPLDTRLRITFQEG